jgi:polyhydroxyalkanoate synthesis regulator phasin
MASKISEIFSRADAKTRILLMLGTVAAIVAVVVIASKYFGGGNKVTGNAKVAGAPSLQSVPGGQLTPEYYRALMQANAQTAQQAQVSGSSAVPTLVNAPQQEAPPVPASDNNCTVMCPGAEAADVSGEIASIMKLGKLPAADAAQLQAMAKADVPVSEYNAYLDKMVKEGKLSPEQARKLLDIYQKQHANASVSDGARAMDAMISAGSLPLDSANSLLALQKQNVTPAAYSDTLQELVRQGKITPAAAAQLLAQYTQQQARNAAAEGGSMLKQMATSGQISQEAATDLLALQKGNAPVSAYEAELNRLVASGKMTPETAAKLLAEYKNARTGLGPAATLSAMVAGAEANNNNAIDSLLKGADAAGLKSMTARNASPQEYAAQLDQLVKQGKLSSESAAKLKTNYAQLNALKAESNKLVALQGNNASLPQYSAELTHGVDQRVFTPVQAASLVDEYRAMTAPVNLPARVTPGSGVNPAIQTNIAGGENFAVLQQRLSSQQPTVGTPAAAGAPTGPDQAAQFAAAEAEAEAQAARDEQQRVQEIMAAMSGQATSLIGSWTPPVMQYKAGGDDMKKKGGTSTTTTTTTKSGSQNGSGSANGGASGPPIIKAGTILFAILTTAVDSDYPDTPVMATIVSGQFKGATLLGKLALAQGQNKVSLNFTIMNRDEWPSTKSVTAFAIDPDTARTVMASNVNNHYMLRYGTMFASSFVTGYANGISQSGSTTTSGIFGTSSTHPQLSPGEKIAVALGQVGTTFGTALASYVNTPATVKVNSGVGLGILFMADVT